jgi:hypothetical protein
MLMKKSQSTILTSGLKLYALFCVIWIIIVSNTCLIAGNDKMNLMYVISFNQANRLCKAGILHEDTEV